MISTAQNRSKTRIALGDRLHSLMRAALSAFVLAQPIPESAWAQRDYPHKPVRVVVPFPAGGALDIPTRIVTDRLALRLGQAFVVENRPGASGNIGTEQVVRAAADGYLLLMGAAANTAVNRYVYPKLPFDVDHDLTPIGQFGVSTNVIYVHPSLPVSSLAELVKLIRRQPGKLNYASPGAGTTPHLAMELLKARQKIFVVHIPYRGSPPAVGSVSSGELQIGIDAVIAAGPQIRSGRLKALAVTNENRVSTLPDTPTVAEAGFSGLETSSYLGFFAPAGTPAEIVAKLGAELAFALNAPEVIERLQRAGIEPQFLPAAKFIERIKRDREAFREAVNFARVTPD